MLSRVMRLRRLARLRDAMNATACACAVQLLRCSDARRRGARNRETCRRFTLGFTFQPIGRNETFRNFDFRAVEPPIRYPVSQTAVALNCSQANRFALLKYLVLHLVSQNRCCGRYRLNTLPHSTQSCVRLFVFLFAISRSPSSSPVSFP